MGELTDKIKGNVNEAVGKVKQAIGGHNGDTELHDEGVAQQAQGKGEQFKGKVKGALGDDI
ncbi:MULTISPECIES: CsbD family protein [unclassified Sphingomonas]|uniref:CsbD family protein n=1 Tax=unclassified Sphingomonas TaxID=196159 RepID=UPI00226A073C|nr:MULTISPECIES: CsbD family protein [unclassified Sphingomonas]